MTNKEKVKILFEKISSMDYGETITHVEISNLIECSYQTQNYNSIVQKVKKQLLVNQKYIESVHKVGYRVVNPDDYTEKSYQCYQQGIKRVKKGNDILVNAPVSKMSDEGRKVYCDVSDRARALYAVMAGSCVEICNLKKKDHPLLHTSKN